MSKILTNFAEISKNYGAYAQDVNNFEIWGWKTRSGKKEKGGDRR